MSFWLYRSVRRLSMVRTWVESRSTLQCFQWLMAPSAFWCLVCVQSVKRQANSGPVGHRQVRKKAAAKEKLEQDRDAFLDSLAAKRETEKRAGSSRTPGLLQRLWNDTG